MEFFQRSTSALCVSLCHFLSVLPLRLLLLRLCQKVESYTDSCCCSSLIINLIFSGHLAGPDFVDVAKLIVEFNFCFSFVGMVVSAVLRGSRGRKVL